MRSNKQRLLIAVTMFICATPVIAAQDIPPPKLDSEDSILAWAKNAKIKDNTGSPAIGWQLLGATDEGLHLATIQSKKDAANMAKVGVRLERFAAEGAVRSEATFFDLDCGKSQIRPTAISNYADHNLVGAKQDRPVPAAWAPTDSNDIVAAIAQDACSAAAPKLTTEKEIQEWMAANDVRDRALNGQLRWTLLGPTPEGVLYTSRNGQDDQARSVEVNLKLERFNPASNPKIGSSLSESIEYEVNCNTKVMRQTAEARHVKHNLDGPSDANATKLAWKPIKDNAVMGKGLEAMCRDFVVQREFNLKAK